MIIGKATTILRSAGLQPQIIVTAPMLSTLTVKLGSAIIGSYTLVGTETSHTFAVNKNSTAYTIECAEGASTYSTTLLANETKIYYVTMAGYRFLEYIESSGTQYIDTEYIPNANTKVEIDFNPISSLSWASIFGADGATFAIQQPASNRRLYPEFYGNYLGDTHYIAYSYNTRAIAILDGPNSLFSYNGTQRSISVSSRTYSTCSMYIFGKYGETGVSFSMKLYELKVYESGVLLKDFKPCIRLSDNEAGVYDTISNIFYENIGTGSFTPGPYVD